MLVHVGVRLASSSRSLITLGGMRSESCKTSMAFLYEGVANLYARTMLDSKRDVELFDEFGFNLILRFPKSYVKFIIAIIGAEKLD